jgi:hypothetical protein
MRSKRHLPKPRLAALVLALSLAWSASSAAVTTSAKTHVVAFGLWAGQSVFASEADKAAHIMAARYGKGGRVIVRVNSRQQTHAMISDLVASIDALATAMDRDRDILMLILTSHGSPDGIAVKGGGRDQLLTPGRLKQILDDSGIRNRVLIISACYSGVFADRLADDHTLIITAADAHHPSFGCRDGSIWTYFGDAFFHRAIPRSATVAAAFSTATAIVAEREKRHGFPSSNPQMRGGQALMVRLDAAP